MKEAIKGMLEHLEFIYGIKVLFAIEQGSRTWGLDDEGSDYDVKFVYVHKLDKYLDMNKPRDYIEYQSDDELINIVGFDIYKFAGLFSKSNPAGIEWIRSCIVHYGKVPLAFKWLAEKEFDPIALFFHYKSLCKGNYVKYVASGNNVTPKRYLSIMRAIVCALYIKKYNKLPPNNFYACYGLVTDDMNNDITYQINAIIQRKYNGNGRDVIERKVILDNYIEAFLNDKDNDIPKRRMDIEAVNREVKNIVYNQR